MGLDDGGNTMSFKINNQGKKIVRILGYGQFAVDDETLNEINTIDNSIVKLLENEENDNSVHPEFERQLKLLDDLVIEARKIFKGEGIIKDTY